MKNLRKAPLSDILKRKGGDVVKRFLKEQFFVLIGTAVLAVAINNFLTPNKLSAGGVSSVGTILQHLFGIRLSLTNLVCNAVLFVLGYRYLGKSALIKTVLGVVYLSAFLELTRYIPVYTDDLLIAALCGGFFLGIGVGLVVRQGASTGGSDFAGLILRHFFPHISVATLILILDVAVVLLTGVVFRSFTVTVYSVVALVTASALTDKVVAFGDRAKTVYLFTEKTEEIADYVMHDFERGATAIPCRGMYSGRCYDMLMCVVSPKELPLLQRKARELDPNVFMVTHDAVEVLGEGFKEDK